MKTRNSFVSNSSSSSYIIIGNKTPKFPDKSEEDILDYPSDLGTTEFGWDPADHCSMWDRINFAWIQATNAGEAWNKELQDYICTTSNEMNLLEEVIKEIFGVKEIQWNMSTTWETKDLYCYIDHQSSGKEGMNMELFENKDTLIQFLFAPDSYIHTDNDNY